MEISNGSPLTQKTPDKHVTTQEVEVGRTAMSVENGSAVDCEQGEPQTPPGVGATTGDRAAAEDASYNSLRSKKLKLENGTERQNQRKRSRARTVQHNKGKI
jgi:hypothetical protein